MHRTICAHACICIAPYVPMHICIAPYVPMHVYASHHMCPNKYAQDHKWLRACKHRTASNSFLVYAGRMLPRVPEFVSSQLHEADTPVLDSCYTKPKTHKKEPSFLEVQIHTCACAAEYATCISECTLKNKIVHVWCCVLCADQPFPRNQPWRLVRCIHVIRESMNWDRTVRIVSPL